MAGNVWEWTSTRLAEDRRRGAEDERVIRGGGWGDVDPDRVRPTGRGRAAATARIDTVGFRCAR